MTPAESLVQFSATFNRASAAEHCVKAVAERAALQNAFPRESLATMPVEKYAMGQGGNNSLCWSYEFNSDHVGSIKGNSVFKFVVWFGKDGSLLTSAKDEPNAALAWEKLRTGLVRALELCDAGQFSETDAVPFARLASALRVKLQHVFFPDEVLPIFSCGHLAHFLGELGVTWKSDRTKDRYTATANRLLLLELRKIPALASWTTSELERLLYAWRPAEKPDAKKGKTTSGAAVVPEPPITSTMKHTLNQILFGPPGTGKTYRVIRKAAEIVTGTPLADDAEAKREFDRLCVSRRVRLATFHQSFSYEDFIEGIRPMMDEGEARFRVQDGMFKRIATEALFACLERVPDAGKSNEFLARWDTLLGLIDENAELEIQGLKGVKWLLSETEQGNLTARNKETGSALSCGRAALAKVWSALHPQKNVVSMDVSKALGKGAHFGVLAAVYNHLQKIQPPVAASREPAGETRASSDMPQVVQDYLERREASGWRMKAAADCPPFVLVVDEINRGNISRVFGELITLIEDDKRWGADNALMVTLPTSGELFTVPPNLYLLGTMNTADKSLAMLDVALRRRFEFVELAPDFSVCSELPPEMRTALEKLNERLERRKDRDHQIGHAFFKGVRDAAEFDRVFQKKVLPLLQEYFFNDVEGARYVLGETGSDEGFLRRIKPDGDVDKMQRNHWRWNSDPTESCWEQLKANFKL